VAETVQSLEGLATLKPAAPEAPHYVQKLDAQGRAYATGKRKNAVARVWIKPGSGKITVNTRTIEVFFARPVLRMMINQPLVAANRVTQYDVICTVSGGGLSGQAGPARRAQEGRLPHPRLARGGTQEVRPRQSASFVPVLQALSFGHNTIFKGRAARRALFVCRGACLFSAQKRHAVLGVVLALFPRAPFNR